MTTTKVLIEKLNDLQIIQTSNWEEDIPSEIWTEYFNGKYTTVEYGLNVDQHRHYETSTEVLNFDNEFIGVDSITNLYSDQSMYEDCYHTLKFYEMEEYSTISYKAKK